MNTKTAGSISVLFVSIFLQLLKHQANEEKFWKRFMFASRMWIFSFIHPRQNSYVWQVKCSCLYMAPISSLGLAHVLGAMVFLSITIPVTFQYRFLILIDAMIFTNRISIYLFLLYSRIFISTNTAFSFSVVSYVFFLQILNWLLKEIQSLTID